MSFDASFFMGAFDIAGGRVKEIVAGEVEEAGIELDGGTEAGENDAG